MLTCDGVYPGQFHASSRGAVQFILRSQCNSHRGDFEPAVIILSDSIAVIACGLFKGGHVTGRVIHLQEFQMQGIVVRVLLESGTEKILSLLNPSICQVDIGFG
jgi:hypothetical protein